MRSAIATAVFIAATAGFLGSAQAQDIDLMQYADANMDGKVTMEEYTAFSDQSWGFLSQGADKLKAATLEEPAKSVFASVPPDANGDITKEGYMASVPARFKAADKNGDGSLNAAELNATMKPPG